jgi:4-amino-4-deoxy-L-arabinose transferase-like glycosyltransferase
VRRTEPSVAEASRARSPVARALVSNAVPAGIFAAALAVRLWHIDWALPTASRLFSFHPDEAVVVSHALDPFRLQLDPKFYAYGALPLLLDGAAIHLGRAVGFIGPDPAPGVPGAHALLLARLVTALLGAATCLFLCGAGRALYDRRAGRVAACLYACAPLAVQHGHWATVDVTATCFVAGAFYFTARAASAPDGDPTSILWAGAWSGFAAASKYNGALMLLPVLVVWWIREPRRLPVVVVTLLSFVTALVVACPTLLLNPGGVLEDVQREAQHMSAGHGAVFRGTGSGFVYQVAHNLDWGLTTPLLLWVLAGVVGAIVRRSRADAIVAAFALPYYLVIGLASVKFARYALPLLPALLLWAGALVTSMSRWRRDAGRAAMVVVGLAATWALLFALALDRSMGGRDPRDDAADFVRSRGDIAKVGFATGPWFYSPSLAPSLGNPDIAVARASVAGSALPMLMAPSKSWNAESIAGGALDAVAVSETEYGDMQRLANPLALSYLASVERMLPQAHVFARPVELFGLRFTTLDTHRGLPEQSLPHDMGYTNPTEVVFTR